MKHDIHSGPAAGWAKGQGKFWTIVDVDRVAASRFFEKWRENRPQ